MIRLAFAGVCVVLAGTAIAGPLDGRWAMSRDDCRLDPGTSDRIPVTIADDRMDFYESICEISAIEEIGGQASAWRVARECRGEGEVWTVSSIFAIDRDADGAPRQLIEIDLNEGLVIVRQHCQ